ncbi:MAG: hypothetical protein ABW137_09270 [Mycobacterium sp.]
MRMTPCTAGVAAVIAVVALTSAACGGGPSASSSGSPSTTSSQSPRASSSESTAPVDYTTLLIAAEDIQIPDEIFTMSQPQANPGGANGAAASFDNEGGTRTISDSIIVMPDAAAAKTALDGGVAALNLSIAEPAPEPAAVGTEGVIASGPSPDGSRDVTVVTFFRGAAYVVMEFDSAAGDPVPADIAVALAQKQADVIKAALG